MNSDLVMALEENTVESKEHTYVVCPGSVFDMDAYAASTASESSLPVAITPMLPSTTVKCGESGSSENSCSILGGEHHIIVSGVDSVLNVVFRGFTFSNNRQISIAGWADQFSSMTFVDCHWKMRAH